ncbi:MAG: NUDIX hydrolase [Candidatus Pacebacteria bacterium]|nr:NUDIX hydrolase [Candidatus Paceibacterota bacterium]
MEKAPQQSPHFPDAFYRVAVKGLHVENGKVLMSHDAVHATPVWELPGGGLDFGESIEETLRREIKEEMGLEVASVAEKPTYLWTNRNEAARGMEWFHVFILAYRIEIKSIENLVPTPECQGVKFFSKEELEQADDLNQQMRPFAKLFNPADFA